MLNAICVHEAAHAAVSWAVLRVVPQQIVFHATATPPYAQVFNTIGDPRHGGDANNFAAYFEAGRIAVESAIYRGLLPPDTNPNHGYNVPWGADCDAYKIDLLKQRYGEGFIALRTTIAEREVTAMWSKIETLALALEAKGTLNQHDIEQILTA